MRKVLVITYYWPPSGGAGVQRWLKFVKYLPQFGIQPYVLTVNPDNASYAVTDETLLADVPEGTPVYHTKSLEPFGAYKKISATKQIPQAGFANEKDAGFVEKAARFVRGNFFIPDARIGWNNYAFKKACEIIEKEGIDMVVTTSPPHSTQLIGLRIKNKYNLRWIADMRDPWTDIYYYSKLYHTPLASYIDRRYERKVLQQADNVVVVSKDIKRILQAKNYALDGNKIEVIPNGFDHTDFENTVNPINSSFVITYTGTLSNDYPFVELINVLAELIAAGHTITLRFFGSLPGNLAGLATEKLGTNVQFFTHVKHSKAIEEMQTSNALLLLIPNVPGNLGILTGKLFEYLAAQKPIIGLGPDNGDAAEIINTCNAGKMVNPGDEATLKQFVLQLLNNHQQGIANLSNAAEVAKFSRRALSEKMASVIIDS